MLPADVRRESQDDAAAPEDKTMPERERSGLFQAIDQNDRKHTEAHTRLRHDLDKLEEQVNQGLEGLRSMARSNLAKIESIERTPVDATKLMLRAPVVVTVIIVALGGVGAVWSIRSGQDRLSDKVEAAFKLQQVQYDALKTAVDQNSRRTELQQYEIQGIKEMILTGKIRVASKEGAK